VVVGDADVVDAANVRVVEVRDEVVLAQEALEGRAALDHVRDLAEDLEHPLAPRGDALGEEHARRTADRDAPQATVAADPHGTEAVRGQWLTRCA
jgi:hypothetical protein